MPADRGAHVALDGLHRGADDVLAATREELLGGLLDDGQPMPGYLLPELLFGSLEQLGYVAFSAPDPLGLSTASLTDAGLANLKTMTKLKWLRLTHARITDAGLVYLEGMVNLQTLILYDTQITEAGVQRLKKALPNVRFYYR